MAQLGANLPGDWKIDKAGKRGMLVKVKEDVDNTLTLTDAAADLPIAVLNYDHKANEQVSAKQIQNGQVLEILFKGAVEHGHAIGVDGTNEGYAKQVTSGRRLGFSQKDYADLDLGQVFISTSG